MITLISHLGIKSHPCQSLIGIIVSLMWMQLRKLPPDGTEKKSIYIVNIFYQRNLNCQLHRYRVIIQRYLSYSCLFFKSQYLISNKGPDQDIPLMFSTLFFVNIISLEPHFIYFWGVLGDPFWYYICFKQIVASLIYLSIYCFTKYFNRALIQGFFFGGVRGHFFGFEML